MALTAVTSVPEAFHVPPGYLVLYNILGKAF